MLALLFIATLPADCLSDLNFLPTYLQQNDAGGTAALQQKGPALFDKALADARGKSAKDDKGCSQVLTDYLRAYRNCHLEIDSIKIEHDDEAVPTAPKAPTFRIVSATTALLVVPSFHDDQAELLKTLLDKNASVIASHPNLLIDVRGNSGGSDYVYAPLMALVEANITRNVGVEFLATPDNIKATEAACALDTPPSEHCKTAMAGLAAAMRKAKPGTFFRPDETRPAVFVDTPKKIAASPQHVGVLIDKNCGSSCEQFVLKAKQSFKTKLFGRSTYGCLDYANMRPVLLPSGKRHLLYATSRSLRLPYLPVDVAGIPPDQYLPKGDSPDADITAAQAVLESAR